MFSIGEFSRATGLTVKTLRFYHEQGILVPSRVEAGSGYRFYAAQKIETARVIASLRELEFSIAEISEILNQHDDDADIVGFLEVRRTELHERMKKDRRLVRTLDVIITHEREANQTMSKALYEIEVKTVAPMLVASMQMQGRYSDCGKGFGTIGRKFGRHLCGPAMMLCHDSEYRAEDATFEVAMPVKKGESTEDISVREVPGGKCLSLMHVGPYDEIGRSYERVMKHAGKVGFKYSTPTREIYHKGPGIIFRGNPKKYLTEIQLFQDAGEDA